METVDASIDVEVPVGTAYNQWTQFESFPEFMGSIEEVRQLDDETLAWRAKIMGREHKWTARIVDQVPDQVIQWRTVSGVRHDGTVRFQPIGAERTRVSLELAYEPQDWMEEAGAKAGVLARRVRSDLERFKEFIEGRGIEEGAWRGQIRGGRRVS